MFTPPLPPARTAAETCRVDLDRVKATVGVALGLATLGRAVDLAGLDATLGRLCAQVLDLHPTEGSAFRPELQALDARLAGLAGALAQPHR